MNQVAIELWEIAVLLFSLNKSVIRGHLRPVRNWINLSQLFSDEYKVMGEKIRLLWIDLSTADADAQPETLLEDYFEITICRRHERVARRLSDDDPEVVCFSFDYPDRSGSRLVEEMKRLYSSTPMFITTVQHSEELAV